MSRIRKLNRRKTKRLGWWRRTRSRGELRLKRRSFREDELSIGEGVGEGGEALTRSRRRGRRRKEDRRKERRAEDILRPTCLDKLCQNPFEYYSYD